MTFANWCLFIGLLLLIMSIWDCLLKKNSVQFSRGLHDPRRGRWSLRLGTYRPEHENS